MKTPQNSNSVREREKEIVDILLDSDLYLDMDLAERSRLVHFIILSYFRSSAR